MGFPPHCTKSSLGLESTEVSLLADTSQYYLKETNSGDIRCYLKKYHSLKILYSLSNLLELVKLPVHLPAENGKKASRFLKFPSLSRKWPGLNSRGVSHCSGSYRTDAIFGKTMVPCKEETTDTVLLTNLSPLSFCLVDKTSVRCHSFLCADIKWLEEYLARKQELLVFFLAGNYQFPALRPCQWVLLALVMLVQLYCGAHFY